MSRLFLLAYTSSGLAGLIYQVCWTRLLTLYIGHTTAAASAVVAAFLGGLAVGAAAGGTFAMRLSPRRSLQTYAALEVAVAAIALIVPIALGALTPVLQWAYAESSPGALFPAVRLASCLLLVFIPAAALGATFPMAIRWLARGSDHQAQVGGLLYALNTTGAAVGALAAGFVLIPRVGLSGTTRVAMAASVLAAVCAWVVSRQGRDQGSGNRDQPPKNKDPRGWRCWCLGSQVSPHSCTRSRGRAF
ncbi:MAG TPA: fused MFS/spermidine synthase [Vicinamibacterales bacterium]|nr:fused MFS/spermidine synthase [Vicinamibacterales bacterium]